MAPKNKVSLNAAELQSRYKDLLAQPRYRDVLSPYLLHQALTRRDPPIEVSLGTVKVWWNKYHDVPTHSLQALNAHVLEDRYGDMVRAVVAENHTPYKLRKALQSFDLPVYVTEAVAKTWLRKFVQYGTDVAQDHSPYELRKALQSLPDPVYVTEAVAKAWLRKFGPYGTRAEIPSVLKRPAAVQYRRLNANLAPVSS